MAYRVTYPLITQDGCRDFATEREAEAFAAERRAASGPYSLPGDWRRVTVRMVPETIS